MIALSEGVAGPDDDKILAAARKDYERARASWSENQRQAEDDLKFARLGEQWPESIKRQREREGRPTLTFNKMPSFIRQVVNDARQNKPAIKVHPQDSSGDPRVAQIISGLIRNIENTSDADVAYDTAIEHAVGQGFGFLRIDTAYTYDDAFDQDIVIRRVANPFTIYGDPSSTAGDSSDWNVAFVATTLSHEEFEREYPGAEKTNWKFDYSDCPEGLSADNETVTVAEYWIREKVVTQIVAMSNGSIVKLADFENGSSDYLGLSIIGHPRDVVTYKVTQRIITGAEILKTVEWAGRYIPIVAVYGDEVIDEQGKRHFLSLIRWAKDAQRMFNYWRTTSTELVALAPRAPWVGEERAFEIDPNWDTANSETHSKLMVPDGAPLPQRQPFSGVPAGALQEALNAADDMKSIIGIHDASLGAKSNETSGRAIMARQREGDVSTFHFIDNLSRAIRHCGRILLDLIPRVYTTERVIRVLGEDMRPSTAQIAPTGQPVAEVPDFETGDVQRIFDITAGKYDLTVKAGPSYTTMREEHRLMMMEAAQAGGERVASVLIPRIAKLMDIPEADTIATELQMKMSGQESANTHQAQDQMQHNLDVIEQQESEIDALKLDAAGKQIDRELKRQELVVKAAELDVKRMEAQANLISLQLANSVQSPSNRRP